MRAILFLALVAACAADYSDHCVGQVFSCKSCRSTMICRKQGSSWKDMGVYVDCPAETPYCAAASGTCSATPDPDCGHDDPAFLCLGDGRYPDPSNCTNYHQCEDLTPSQFPCAEGLQYDPDSQTCKPTSELQGDCALPSCGGQKGIKVPVGDSHYYAYCDQTGTARVVDRCEGDYKLNQTSQQCEALCDREGVLANNDDCTKYWRCDRVWLKPNLGLWLRRDMSCPEDQAYSREQFMCVPLAQVPGCGGPAPTTQQPTHPPSSTEPSTTEPTTSEPSTSEPSTSEPTTAATSTSEPTTVTPTGTSVYKALKTPKSSFLSHFFNGWNAGPDRFGRI